MRSFLRSLSCFGSSPSSYSFYSSTTTSLPPPPLPPRPAASRHFRPAAIALLPHPQVRREPSALLVRRSLAGHPVPTNLTVVIPARRLLPARC
ncbi:hypothetical protein E8E11_008459 [Didymella keratinophila]|nr:hypothetical protein E8E11_008459 [Didymella keratinophila]